jgi:hypothetical protein
MKQHLTTIEKKLQDLKNKQEDMEGHEEGLGELTTSALVWSAALVCVRVCLCVYVCLSTHPAVFLAK